MGWFSNRLGTPVDNGVCLKNTHKIVEETRVQNIPRAFMSSNDVPVLLLNQPLIRKENVRKLDNKKKQKNNCIIKRSQSVLKVEHTIMTVKSAVYPQRAHGYDSHLMKSLKKCISLQRLIEYIINSRARA